MKIRILIALISVVLLTFACSDDDNGTNSPSDNNGDIVGTWTMESYEAVVANQSSGVIDVSGSNFDITFSDNGEFNGYLYNVQGTGYSGSGTYTYNGNKLVITDDGGDKTEYTAQISGDKMTVSSTAKYSGLNYEIIMKFTK